MKEALIDLFKEVRLLSNKGQNINGIVVNRSIENKGNYPYAIALQESFRAFQNSCDKIKNEPRIDRLIAKQKKDILSEALDLFEHASDRHYQKKGKYIDITYKLNGQDHSFTYDAKKGVMLNER